VVEKEDEEEEENTGFLIPDLPFITGKNKLNSFEGFRALPARPSV
jgi:hypothetical protein